MGNKIISVFRVDLVSAGKKVNKTLFWVVCKVILIILN